MTATVAASQVSGSGAIVPGSGGYAGRGQQLSQVFAIPFIDGLEAALDYCETAALNQLGVRGSVGRITVKGPVDSCTNRG